MEIIVIIICKISIKFAKNLYFLFSILLHVQKPLNIFFFNSIKRKMRKIFASLFIVVVFLMVSFVLAAEGLSEELEDFVKKVAEKRGINKGDITNVTEVNFNDLPDEVKIENIDQSNLAIYKIDSKTGDPTFVITFSDKGFQKVSKSVDYTTLLLNFGMDEEINSSTFLKTATGVLGDLNKGYVMLREGSITGISTNLEILETNNEGEIQIIIYKNNEEVGFGNLINVLSLGIKKDYDIQSKDIVTFNPGDVISVYAKVQGEVVFKDVITVIEISTVVS